MRLCPMNEGPPVECHDCKNGLLDLAYGLLEPAEADAIRAHAATCEACSTELAQTSRMKTLLGRAAMFTFDEVEFTAPLAEPATPRRTWARPVAVVAVAAAMLVAVIAIPPLLTPTADDRPGYAAIDTTPKDTDPKPNVVVPNSRGIRENAPGEWTAETAADAKVKYRITVLGPREPKLGSEYSITAIDATGKPITVRVTAFVKDAKATYGKKSFETDATWTLTPDIFEKLPAENVSLQVFATQSETGDRVTLSVPLR